MSRLTLEVQAANTAIEANLRGHLSYAQQAAQALNRRRGPAHYERVFNRTPVLTGFMREHLRFEPTPNDFGYRLGWAREDFEAAGFYPYYRVVLFGSRHRVGYDYFSPIAEEERRAYRAEMREIMRSGGPLGGRRRG